MSELLKFPVQPYKFRGDLMKSRRVSMGLTLNELGKKMGSSKSYMWELENGHKDIGGARLIRLSDILHADPRYFYDGGESK